MRSMTALLALLLLAISWRVSAAKPETRTLAEEELIGLLPDDDGKILVATYCGMCHSLKNTVLGARDRDQWLGTVEKMVLEYHAPIDDAEIDQIADYLGKYSGPDNPVADLPLDINSVSAEALQRLPFLSPDEVKAVLQLRSRKGKISSLDELGAVVAADKLSRLSGYLRASGTDGSPP